VYIETSPQAELYQHGSAARQAVDNHAFLVVGPHIWKDLPAYGRLLSLYPHSASDLVKTHLFLKLFPGHFLDVS